jgi:hypothetical protein
MMVTGQGNPNQFLDTCDVKEEEEKKKNKY